MNKLTVFLLIAFSLLSLFLNLYHRDKVPPCLNADEAAFGYNAYSILKTSRDEYGSLLPFRLKSFGDYKMPLYSYLSIPIIALFGLNDNSARGLNTLISLFLPIVIYFLAYEIFKNRKVALASSFLVSISVGLQIIGKQAHEAYLTIFLISLTTLFFLRSIEKKNWTNYLFFFIFLFLSLFGYQSSRIYAVFFLIAAGIYKFLKKKLTINFFIIFIFVIGIFALTDLINKPERVKNLFFTSNIGFTLKINELMSENSNRLLYNKATVGFKDIIFEHLKYFSPQFLVTEGDTNLRFGSIGISQITVIEYFFIFIGLYFIFKNKEKWRYLLLSLVIISPITGSLSWAQTSLTRSLFLLIPLIIIKAYGFVNLIYTVNHKYKKITFLTVCLIFIFFWFYSWDFYINHYPKRALVTQAWQCGYKELVSYINEKYNSINKFYITKKNGQPYIFLLFYQKYQPAKYQKMAKLTPPDEYGFGQVEAFDKFDFNFKIPNNENKYITVGYPDDFTSMPDDQKLPESKIKKIIINNQEIFWIYEKD